MNPYIFDLNTYVKADSALNTLCGGVPNIHPLVGYDSSVAPIILYWWLPHILRKNEFFIYSAYLRYHVLDSDAERGMKIQQRLIEKLNVGDLIQGQVASTNARALYSFLLHSGAGTFESTLGAPKEREGWYNFQVNFEVGYIPLV